MTVREPALRRTARPPDAATHHLMGGRFAGLAFRQGAFASGAGGLNASAQ
ncbi:hypothetical protein ACGFW5_15365 [Streptomyces sp. NPDC048416]